MFNDTCFSRDGHSVSCITIPYSMFANHQKPTSGHQVKRAANMVIGNGHFQSSSGICVSTYGLDAHYHPPRVSLQRPGIIKQHLLKLWYVSGQEMLWARLSCTCRIMLCDAITKPCRAISRHTPHFEVHARCDAHEAKVCAHVMPCCTLMTN